MFKFYWKIKIFPTFFLIKKVAIIFQQCVMVSYNLFIQEHYKQVNLFGIWTLLRHPFSWVLHRVECLILEYFWFQIKSFWLLFNWSMITCGILVTKVKQITFEIDKVLITVISPWTVKFLILQILRIFSIFLISLIKFSSFSMSYYKKNEYLRFSLSYLLNLYITSHRVPLTPLSGRQFQQFHISTC